MISLNIENLVIFRLKGSLEMFYFTLFTDLIITEIQVQTVEHLDVISIWTLRDETSLDNQSLVKAELMPFLIQLMLIHQSFLIQ